MKHKKKTWPQDFQKILDGKKTFDLRLADWKCHEGDTLVLQEWDPQTKKYTGRSIEKEITYIVKIRNMKYFSPEEIKKYGYQIFSFK